jgi:hypothetical protein
MLNSSEILRNPATGSVIKMNLPAYSKTQQFVEGFPQGDTFLNLEELDVSDSEADYDGQKRKVTLLKTKEGKEYYCPKSVIKQLIECHMQGFKKARITRVGKTLNDTKYTVLGQQ